MSDLSRRGWVWVLASGVLFVGAVPAQGQVQHRAGAYDPVNSAQEAFRQNEEIRQQAVRNQLGLIEDLKAYSGLSSWYGGSTYYYRPLSLDYLYGMGIDGRGRPGISLGRGGGSIFERWPYVPGDIWGYTPDRPVRQSLGQRQVQVGPNRWESFPVYADTDAPRGSKPAVPPPPRLPPPPKAQDRGPREF